MKRRTALIAGLLTHLLFICAVWKMFWGVRAGLADGQGALSGAPAFFVNGILLLQFPFLHSTLISRPGRRLLTRVAGDLSTTLYAFIASAQLFILFTFWTPSTIVLFTFPAAAAVVLDVLNVAAWLFLAKTMSDAGLSYQVGALGWLAVFRGKRPVYPPMPERGTFKLVRQPIYLAFLLILLTSRSGTLDRIVLTGAWGAYLLLAPLLKERRFAAYYGSAFQEYRKKTPYFLPKI